MLLHLSYVDHQRHRLGVHGDLEHAFRFIDGQMGLVLDALEETGGVYVSPIPDDLTYVDAM